MHRSSNAFTLLEIMLALVLAVVLIGGALGLFGLVFTEDRLSAARFRQETDLQVAQIIIRRAMQNLVAGEPQDPDENARDTAEADDEQSPRVDDPSTPEDESLITDEEQKQIDTIRGGGLEDATIRGTTPESEDDKTKSANPLLALLSMQPDSDEDFFEFFEEEAEGGAVVPRMQLVLSTSPVPKSMIPPEDDSIEAQLVEKMRPWIRGAFELTPLADGWALQWMPMDPPGQPFVLARGLESCAWRVLPRRNKDDERSGEWQPQWQAYLAEDFPIAVELSLRTNKGVNVDWVFETVVKGP